MKKINDSSSYWGWPGKMVHYATDINTFNNVDEVDHALFNYIHLIELTHLCVV